LIVGCHAAGVITFGFFLPLLLRIFDPFALLRAGFLLQSCGALGCALCGYISQKVAFAVLFSLIRFVLGGMALMCELASQAIAFRCVSADKAPVAMAGLIVIRSLGTTLSPTIGGALYPLASGGWPLPFFAAAMLFLLLYAALFATNAYAASMPPDTKSASVLQVLSSLGTWFATGLFFLMFFGGLMLEPLYSPVLSQLPYAMGYSDIGLMASIFPISSLVAIIIGTIVLRRILKEHTTPHQIIGVSIIFVGYLALGNFFTLVTPSTGLFVTGLVFVGGGCGFIIPSHPTIMLRILWRDKGLTKDELGGALAATTTTCLYIAGFIAPTAGSGVYDAVGFPALMTGLAIFFVAGAAICIALLYKYDDPSPTPPTPSNQGWSKASEQGI